MSNSTLEINGHCYRLPDENLEAARDQIVQLVRSGGGFLTVTTGAGMVDVLLSPGMDLRIVHRQETSEYEAAGAVGAEFVFPSFDEYGL
ncbi:hypothetical protein [Leifsonia shinshuensis]|uniref:hypothetical protein n=1 Tax=Leifsonia shinshuensis TaxID=150026 RepID=UPI0028542C7C|nr:hypothetical protein [Leifsonia shinshuensis]MDR6972717.1 archaeosine-15-forming tRNA-guanine transglycosylase [Leifsonia shinshuensis]